METVLEMPRRVEACVLPSKRRENRTILQRLFQGYVSDYGDKAGWKIIRVIIYEIGGFRLLIPKEINQIGELLRGFYAHLCEEFGDASGDAIMRKFIIELGGLRISFPTFDELFRQERNERIRARVNGGTPCRMSELSEQYGVSVRQIWRVKNGN